MGRPADFVEHFDAVGFHACGFAGGENNGGEGHGVFPLKSFGLCGKV